MKHPPYPPDPDRHHRDRHVLHRQQLLRRVRDGRGHAVPLLPGGPGAQRRHARPALLHVARAAEDSGEDAKVQRRSVKCSECAM